MASPVALITGVALDAAFGDPPNAAHPVAWFGRVAHLVDRHAPRSRTAGLLAASALVTGAAVLGGAIERVAGHSGAALILWMTISRRALLARAAEVATALEADDLPTARLLLARHLVSRDTSMLNASEMAGATIESVAENLSDGVIAPCCWYLLVGGAGAAGYRSLNTLDGMWGYRTPQYESFGWAAAGGDDVANLLPARVTAVALIVAAGANAPRAARAWRDSRRLTASPNAGHPMSAMAGALGVVLEKRGEYALGEGGRAATATDVRRAVTIADRASVVALLVALALARRR